MHGGTLKAYTFYVALAPSGMDSYGRGFEDGLEAALKVIRESRELREAAMRIEYLLGLVKERKFEALERELGAFGF